jgi:hypothetical protein
MRESAANISALAALFVDLPGGDLHLAPGATQAIDKGVSLAGAAPADIDGDIRKSQPDAGCDEAVNDPPAAPANLRLK